MIDRDYEAAFALIRTALFGCDLDAPIPDWAGVYSAMEEQAILPLVMNVLRPEDVNDATLYKKWRGQSTAQIIFNNKLLYLQQQLLELMKENDIPVVILKGAAASMYYPRPELRTMGDIDFMVLPKDFDRAYQVMLEDGYTLQYEKDFVRYHYTLQKNDAEFELHRYPPGAGITKQWDFLKELFYEVFDHIEEGSMWEFSFPVFSPLQNGFVLLLHIVKHLSHGLGLRQIIDWEMYVDRVLSDEFWEKEFAPVAEEAGLVTLAKTVTRLCQLYLGLRTEGITWCADADESLCEELLGYFMEQGNFGRKAGLEEDHGARLVSRIRNPIDVFRLLQKHGSERWKAIEKHPWLRAFAWLYQIFAYLKTILTRKGTLKNWSKDAQVGRGRGKMFEKLQVYQK